MRVRTAAGQKQRTRTITHPSVLASIHPRGIPNSRRRFVSSLPSPRVQVMDANWEDSTFKGLHVRRGPSPKESPLRSCKFRRVCRDLAITRVGLSTAQRAISQASGGLLLRTPDGGPGGGASRVRTRPEPFRSSPDGHRPALSGCLQPTVGIGVEMRPGRANARTHTG